MERAPESLDDLQPQDLSTSSSSTVIDLTRKGEECVSSVATLNSLVKSPGWCPNPATCDPHLTLSESPDSSDVKLQSGDQIHPDDALSHTTVTLSYVSRSHVCTTHDSLSQYSPLSGLPAISVLPLCSPPKSEALRGPNQHYSEQVEQPVPTKHFQSPSQAQLGSEDNDPAKESHEVKSDIISREMDEPFQEENNLSQKNSLGLENGDVDGWESPDVSAQTSPEPVVPAPRDGEETGGCEVVFVVSTKPDPVVIPGTTGVRNLCPLNREYISPLEDPVSPSVTSQDGIEDVFDLPQASSSPSADNCYSDTMGGLVWDGSGSESANQLGSKLIAYMGSESSHRDEQPVQKQNTVTEDVCLSDDSKNKPVNAHINGNATALQRTLNKEKLSARSGRGTRLEAIVMNINSSCYKMPGCIRTNKKPDPSRVAECDAKITSSESNGKPSLQKRTSRDKSSLLEDTVKQTVIPAEEGNDDNSNTDSNHDSTSDSLINHSEKPQNSTPPKSPPPAVHETKQPEQLSSSDPTVEIYTARVSPRTQSSKSPKKIKGKAAGSGVAPTATAKTTGSPRSQRKTHKGRKRSQCASMFSPKEPEIKLRYITYREEKRDLRMDSFSPFVHVERRQSSPSLCTVVNYPEEVTTDLKKGQQMPPGSFVTGAVPSTSCLQLGRATAHSQHQRSLVCCLCGQSANAMDLGDLHGPYYPEGYRPAAKRPAGVPGLKEEEEDSNSDSSSFSTIKERGRKRTVQQPSRHLRPAGQLWASDGTGGPAAKQALSDVDSAVSEDWYSAPLLPLEPCEYWLHEDCGIWSAGVYLVKGKVYGLEEAFRVAQETVTLHLRTFVWLYNLRRDKLSVFVGYKLWFDKRCGAVFISPILCIFRSARHAASQGPHWDASPKAVRTSTTTGVLWSQVSSALLPSIPPPYAVIKGQTPPARGYQSGPHMPRYQGLMAQTEADRKLADLLKSGGFLATFQLSRQPRVTSSPPVSVSRVIFTAQLFVFECISLYLLKRQ